MQYVMNYAEKSTVRLKHQEIEKIIRDVVLLAQGGFPSASLNKYMVCGEPICFVTFCQ